MQWNRKPAPSASGPAGSLAELAPGQSAAVRAIDAPEAVRQRLYELGLLPGTRVSCLLVSPLGDPRAYRVRGTVIALRAADAAAVRVDGVTP